MTPASCCFVPTIKEDDSVKEGFVDLKEKKTCTRPGSANRVAADGPKEYSRRS
jgi:hypothetical protein